MKKKTIFSIIAAISFFFIVNEVFANFDTFDNSPLDNSKWQEPEEYIEISNGKLCVGVQNDKNIRKTNLELALINNTTNYNQVDVLIDSSSYNSSGATIATVFGGRYYNDSRGSGSGLAYNEKEGDVWAGIYIWFDNQNNRLVSNAYISRSDNADSSVETELLKENFSTPLSFDTEYTISIEYLNYSQIVFKLNNETLTYQITTPVYPSCTKWRSIICRAIADPGENSYLKAQFDNVYVGNTVSPYDDFNNAEIDTSKWTIAEGSRFERKRAVIDGKLQLDVRGLDQQTSINSFVVYKDINYFQSSVTFQSGSQVSQGAVAAARITGYLYNDSRGSGSGQDYNGLQGDVWVENRIGLDGSGILKGNCAVYNCGYWLNGNYFPDILLFSQDFASPITFDTPCTLSYNHSGSSIIFKCNDESIIYNITTPMYKPAGEEQGIKNRLYLDQGESGYIKTQYDDIVIRVRTKNYRDSDNDGYGDPNSPIEDPSCPDGYVTNNLDCNDYDPTIHPGTIEIRGDGIDQDCTGSDLPGLDEPTTFSILSTNLSSVTVTPEEVAHIYGCSEVNNITIKPGAAAKLINMPGNNVITIQADSNIFSVYRSGATVTFEGTDGTMLKMPATTTTQSIVFNDGVRSLIIDSGSVLLGSQVINSIPAAILPLSPDDATTNSLGMSFVRIQPGTFMMGSPEDELGRRDNETQHQVTLTREYFMLTTEVTQGQWEAVMGNNPSEFSNCGDDCPVEKVSWEDVQEFITQMNLRGEGTYALPTEAQWEYAARAGSTTAFANGDITETECGYDPNLESMGWYCYNSAGETHPVAQKQANTWGLYDMHGNVYEWCQDWYGICSSDAVTDPEGPSSGSDRVLRGGSWFTPARGCRSAYRYDPSPDFRSYSIGFRLILSPGQPSI